MPVIFDLDGTIVDSERAFAALLSEVMNEEGFAVTAEQALVTVSGMTPKRAFAKMSEHLDLRFSEGDISSFVARLEWKQAAAALTRPPKLIPGVKSLMSAFHAGGHVMSLGSNRPSGYSREKLQQAGLAHFFNHRIFGPDSVGGLHKPDPAIFNQAMSLSGPTAIFEDSLAGVMAAQAAGANLIIARLDPCITSAQIVAAKTAEFESFGAKVIRHYDLKEIWSAVCREIPAAPRRKSALSPRSSAAA